MQKPLCRLVRRVEFCAQLLLDIGIDERIGDARRFFRIARRKRHIDRGGHPHGVHRQLLQEIVDGVVELADFGIGFALVVGKEPVHGIERDQGRRCVEIRVLHQVQLVDHLGRQIAGLQHLNLVLHRSGVCRHIGQHRRKIGDVVLARIDHHKRRRCVMRRPQREHQQGQREHAERHIADQAAARTDDAVQIFELEAVPGACGAVAGTGDRSMSTEMIRGHE